MDWLWVLLIAVRGVSSSPDDQWAVRLGQLDIARAEAFATGDVGRLDDVYVAGGAGADTDAAAISAYAERGGRVLGAELRVLSCHVVRSSDREVRLDVVDQLAPSRVEWSDGTVTTLPRDRPSRRLVTVVREGGAWRIAATRQF